VDVPDFEKYKWLFTSALAPVDVKNEKLDLGELKVPSIGPATARIGFPEKGLDKPALPEPQKP
jgi:hypothetical protein